MYSIMVIDPEKLRKARGKRTLQQIVDAAEGKFKAQQLSQWELGKYRPRPENVPYLLNALGVPFSRIAQKIAA